GRCGADGACPFMPLPHWALDLRHPLRVAATGTQFADADNKIPVEMRVDYHYPARGSAPTVHLTWWHGIPGPRDESGKILDFGLRSAVLFHGDDGQLLADYGSHTLLPEEKFCDYRRPEPTIPDSTVHHKEWVEAIKNGGPTTCNFEYSGALSETVLLGNVAYRTGQEISWDAASLRATNAPAADTYLLPRYRGEWQLLRPSELRK